MVIKQSVVVFMGQQSPCLNLQSIRQHLILLLILRSNMEGQSKYQQIEKEVVIWISKKKTISPIRISKLYNLKFIVILGGLTVMFGELPTRPPPIKFSYDSTIANSSPKFPNAVKVSFLRRSASEKDLNAFDIHNIIARSTLTGSVCPLCETRYKLQEMDTLNYECGHSFCRNCIHQYMVYKITVMEDILCPQQGCTLVLDINAHCYINLPENYKQKYAQFLLWKQTINNPNLKLCPKENCKGTLDTLKNFSCNICNTEYCRQCMLQRHQGPCDANFQRNFKEWKRCPACSMFIEKNEGCNHMTCICRHQFCYVCLSNWEERHYQCGQLDDAFGGVNHYNQAALPQCVRNSLILRKLLGISMLIFFPVFLVGGLVVVVAAATIAGCLGFTIGPFIWMCQYHMNDRMIGQLFALLFVPAMIVIGIGAFLYILITVGRKYIQKLQEYCNITNVLLCQRLEDQFENEPWLQY